MKFLIISLFTLASISVFAQSQSVVTSYDCEVDATLRFAGRKVINDGTGCDATVTEGSKAYLSQRFIFNRVASADTKLAATNKLIKECQNLITQFDDDGVYNIACSSKARTMNAMDSSIRKVARELVVDASENFSPDLPNTSEERSISSYNLCRTLVKKYNTCEEVKKIVTP